MEPISFIMGQALGQGGNILSMFGKNRGLTSMSEESERQGNEWKMENEEQQKAIAAEIARRKALLATDVTSPALAANQKTAIGASAMGKGMGLGSGDTARVTGALLPQSTLAAQQTGANAAAVQDRKGMADTINVLNQSRLNQRDRAKMYEQLMQQAAFDGSSQRQWGELMMQGGQIAGGMGGLFSPSAASAPAPTQQSTGMSIFPMAKP